MFLDILIKLQSDTLCFLDMHRLSPWLMAGPFEQLKLFFLINSEHNLETQIETRGWKTSASTEYSNTRLMCQIMCLVKTKKE